MKIRYCNIMKSIYNIYDNVVGNDKISLIKERFLLIKEQASLSLLLMDTESVPESQVNIWLNDLYVINDRLKTIEQMNFINKLIEY